MIHPLGSMNDPTKVCASTTSKRGDVSLGNQEVRDSMSQD